MAVSNYYLGDPALEARIRAQEEYQRRELEKQRFAQLQAAQLSTTLYNTTSVTIPAGVTASVHVCGASADAIWNEVPDPSEFKPLRVSDKLLLLEDTP